ncbi:MULTISPECIES: metal ABC transporter ATP-binding protein [Sedimentibacter]|uniref:ABC transporter ATP-binding protein n=1 Tax=Sedimentibacter hydroxybenzoicus DSM 7310 TaxID=1123245 RepID=A0A974BLX5_SEDHY|nr:MULTISPECIES: ABC transporter ATP-binding protein [Sedimentibacter]NYB75810.1 ABC transporter ATP-binding protein [Sedimentibacter hydroxybenzoicus DSM 7310]
MPKVIEAENLSFSYGNESIFTKIGFSVYKGDFVAVIGSNGTGKSTLMRIILGELTPTGGSIRILNQDVEKFGDWPKIGYLPQSGLQSADSFPATAEEIVMANLFSQIGLLRFPKKKHRDKVHQALELVGMDAYSKRMISELSGGQRQRVMLARVLVSDPEIMILDEPTTGVDAGTVKSLYELLSSLNRETGITIVMVTHDIGRASGYVSRILSLEEGSLEERND